MFFGLVPPRPGPDLEEQLRWESSPLFGEKTGKAEEPWKPLGFTSKGYEMLGAGSTQRAMTSRAHNGDAGRAAQYLLCSAPAACFWQQLHPPAQWQAASPSLPAGVSGQQLGHPSVWPASMEWHISEDLYLQTHPGHLPRM